MLLFEETNRAQSDTPVCGLTRSAHVVEDAAMAAKRRQIN